MNKRYQRIGEISGLTTNEILALAERLRCLDLGPEDIRSSINDRDEIRHHKRAGWDVVRGITLLVASTALVALAPSLTLTGQSVALAMSVTGAALVVLGLNNRGLLHGHVHRARALRRQLEARDGFLWHFQALLEYRDADGPTTIHDSLTRCCQASRRREDVADRQDLVEYFYWLTLVEIHLVVAHKGLHDEGLNPYEASRHE